MEHRGEAGGGGAGGFDEVAAAEVAGLGRFAHWVVVGHCFQDYCLK
jgi:hypothetical protein